MINVEYFDPLRKKLVVPDAIIAVRTKARYLNNQAVHGLTFISGQDYLALRAIAKLCS